MLCLRMGEIVNDVEQIVCSVKPKLPDLKL